MNSLKIRHVPGYIIGGYLGTVVLFSGMSFAGLVMGKGRGEYVPYLHWPIKLLSLLR